MVASYTRTIALAAPLAVLTAALSPAGAKDPEPVVARDDVLAARCASCHQPGASRDGVPPIAGRPAQEIADALRRYRDGGSKKNVMTTRASRLSDEEIDALARAFAAASPDRTPE